MGANAPVKYHYLYRLFTYSVRRGWERSHLLASSRTLLCGHPGRRHCQVGSLAGAAHLLKDNAGVLRGTHREQKSRVEQKGKSPLDFDFQCEYEP